MAEKEHVVDIPIDGPSRSDKDGTITLDRQQQQDTSNSISDSGIVRLSPTVKSPETLITTVEAPAPLTWYFQEDQDISSAEEYIFKCIIEQSPPVKIPANNRFTRWTGDTKQLGGVYNVVLGISFKNLDLDNIESIAFSYSRGSSYNYGPLEVLSRQTLISLVGSNDAVVRLGLHQQHVELNEALKILVVDMEIRTAIGEERKTDSDFIELHYIELHASQLGTDYDSSLKVHRPYLWSIDVAHTNKSADGRIYKKSTRIIHYAVSGDGSHVATLSALDKILYLDVWDVASKSSALTNAAQNNTPQPPLHPWRCAQKQLQLEMAILPSLVISPVTVSVSWNASMITIIAANTKHLKNTFQVFRHNGNLCLVPGKKHVSPPAHSLIYTEIDQLCEQLKGACGFGKFHLTASDNQDPKNELFIVGNEKSVDIYRVQDTWSHVRNIQLINESTSNGPNYKVNYRRLIGGLRGKYFAWRDNKDTISICNLESGLLVSRIPNGQNAHFSSDGSMVAISHPDATITTRWINSNACISSKDACRTSPAHVLGGTRVLVIQMAPDERYGRGQIGLILDAMSMDIICRVSIPLLAFEQQQILTDPDGSCLYSQLGSKVNLIQIENATLQPHLQAADKCGYQCFDNLTYITAMATYATDNEAIVTMASGLTFTARFETLRASSMAPGVEHRPLVISISDGNSRFQEALRVPSVPIGDISVEWLAYKVAFNIERQEMMVYNDIFIMVWGLPETLDGEFTLLLGWWIQFSTFQTKNGLDWLWSGLSRCPHQRYYATTNNMDDYGEYVMVDAVQLDTDDPFSQKNVIQFLDGVLVLVEIFHSGDEQFKDAILQYVGRHLNSYPDPNDLVDNVLGRICRNVNQENYSYYTEFLRALFDSHYGNWVPRPEYNSKTNPIWMLLISAETFPRAMNLAQVLIDYCVRKANKERNWYFVTPILGPLHDLVDRKHLYAQIVRKTLRNLAFIPVMDRSYVIDHHIIAHPPELRWGFWQSNQTPLHKCKDPILQLDYNPTPTEHNLQTDNFTRDMFVASFDLLWREPESSASVKEVNSQASDSLMSIILHAIWLNCKIKSRTTVECHDFELELLDNPAIAALVEYKCGHQRLLVGVFIAIIVLSVIFLWLELIQLVHNWRRYLKSPYNYADIAAFVSPLTGSINQLYNIANDAVDGNTYFMSFAVLFVFIHMLFELRINKTVCHFVTIIVRVMSEIRVFFVVFATGILAFTIAILHLLHACPIGLCERETNFPKHFYGAISSTYFFMGGRYDPVEQEFEDENWPFHTMMIIYFFFTAILLLNVLIALINVAFTVGDETWKLVWIENRLSYAESAENMSYHIPGFRRNHNWFPKEIYYSATIQQVDKYIGDDSGKPDTTHRLFGQGSPAKAAVSTATKAALIGYENTKRQQEELIEGIQKELAHSKTQLSTLNAELTERQLALEAQIRELQIANAAEFKEMKDILSAALASRK